LFENFIVFIILANCAVMAIDKEEDENKTSLREGTLHWHEYVEFIFQTIYTIEMILKIIA
jgi:hypothetical protein